MLLFRLYDVQHFLLFLVSFFRSPIKNNTAVDFFGSREL